MTGPIKPRGHAVIPSAEAGERFNSTAAGLSAFRHAREHGKALVEDGDGVFVISWHPIARPKTDDEPTKD